MGDLSIQAAPAQPLKASRPTDEDAILISHEREKVKGSGEIGLTRKLTNVGESILFLTNQPFPLEIIRIFFCYNKDLRGNKS